MRRIGAILAMGVLGVLARPVVAQQLDPQVAMPLMQLLQAAGSQCQMGNQQACALVPQLQQAGNELTQAQFACQQGNPQACQMFQAGAQQVMMVWQQNFGGGMPQQGYPQQTWNHDQQMLQRQQMFQQHQDRMAQQRAMQDQAHQNFMDQLRR